MPRPKYRNIQEAMDVYTKYDFMEEVSRHYKIELKTIESIDKDDVLLYDNDIPCLHIALNNKYVKSICEFFGERILPVKIFSRLNNVKVFKIIYENVI